MDELKDKIRKLVEETDGRPLKLADMLKALRLPPTEKGAVRRLLREMQADGHLAKLRGHSFVSPKTTKALTGILRASKRGFGFVIPDNDSKNAELGDIFITRKNMGDAFNGDRVQVRLLPRAPGQRPADMKRPEGQIIEVLERGTSQIVGLYYNTKRGGTVVPRDERLNRTISTPKPHPDLGVTDGDYVVTEITTWTHSTEPLLGKVLESLGNPDDKGIDITVIIRDAGVDPDFSAGALEEVEQIPSEISEEEIATRSDFRELVTFTMDGITAKDFDDALSIERLDESTVRLGVHIADVSHYVQENSPLDMDAIDRATSIYPIDRVVPMLPEKLSNGLCSLRPREDRLTVSCFMDIDARGRVHRYSIHNGIIRSAHRLVYENVQLVMDGKAEPALARELGDIRVQLDELYRLREVLTAMRFRRGALDLDIPELEILFDEDGKVKSLVRRPRLESHRVVEECMLIANEVVATHLFNLGVPSVYRVHESPDLDKLRRLQPVLAHLNVRFPAKKELAADAIQGALDQAAKSDTGFIARRLILRSMMRAHYDDENLGHYGLGSTCYTHFTSPIRRYPDLLIHRLLKETAKSGAAIEGRYKPPQLQHGDQEDPLHPDHRSRRSVLSAERTSFLESRMGNWAKHCSDRERRAEDIENDAALVKSLEYMRRFVGQEFDGVITSIINWGMFVELTDMPVEGLIHVSKLGSDFFEYDDERMTLVGRESGEMYKLGDKVRIGVENVNVAALEMDFRLEEKYLPAGSEARLKELHRLRADRTTRHAERKPRTGGFQARGKGKRSGRR